MSSTFAEMFSDFQDTAKLYVEKLDVTEVSFMRMLTRGVQEFQRETEYIEKNIRLQPNANNEVFIPDDMLRYVEIRAIKRDVKDEDLPAILNSNNSYNVTFLHPNQFFQARNNAVDGKNKIIYPNIYLKQPSKINYLATIWDRRILTYPQWEEDFYLRYIPDFPAFARVGIWILPDNVNANPPVYNNWFPLDEVLVVNNLPITRFMYLFTTKRLHESIRQWERTFIEFALAMFIRARGNANYQVFEMTFKQDIEKAKVLKPTLFQQGDPYYMYAPFS